jgi:hypothetical protein
LPGQYLPEIYSDSSRKTHGGITKASDIDYQAKGKSIDVGLKDSGVLLTSLGMQKLLHVVLTSGGKISTSCQSQYAAI